MNSISMSAQNVVMRQAIVKVGADYASLTSVGLVKNVKISIKPSSQEKDSQGRTMVPGYVIEGQFQPMSNKSTQLEDLFMLLTEDFQYCEMRDLNDSTNSFKISDVNFLTESDINMNGEADGMIIKFTKTVATDDLKDMLGVVPPS